MTACRPAPLRFSLVATLLAIACAHATAAGTDSATGTLTVQSEDKPISLKLTHAYYVIGPDTFDSKRTTPRLILTGEDVREAILACKDVSCATYAASDGMTLDLDADAPMSYWAHVRPMQYSGVIDTSQMTLSTKSPDRIAGTLKSRNTGIEVSVSFDASLVKTFSIDGK